MDLELDELDLEECIGRGGHGAVYKARLQSAALGSWPQRMGSDPTQSMVVHMHKFEGVHTAACIDAVPSMKRAVLLTLE